MDMFHRCLRLLMVFLFSLLFLYLNILFLKFFLRAKYLKLYKSVLIILSTFSCSTGTQILYLCMEFCFQADVIVSVLDKTLDMRKTAVGTAVLKKYPHLAKVKVILICKLEAATV